MYNVLHNTTSLTVKEINLIVIFMLPTHQTHLWRFSSTWLTLPLDLTEAKDQTFNAGTSSTWSIFSNPQAPVRLILCPPCSTPPTSTVLYHRKKRDKCARLKEGICALFGPLIAQLSYCKTPVVHSGSDQDRATAGSLYLLKTVSPLIFIS